MIGLPMPKLRLMFSISTVASSTRMPTASARPPSVIVLSVCPIDEKTMIDTRIDSGIETTMTSVERHEPRNSRIISPVSPAAISASRSTPLERGAHEHRLVEQRLDVQLRRQRRLRCAAARRARAARCRASTRSASSARSAAPSAGRRRAPWRSGWRSRRAPAPRRSDRRSPPPSCRTGMSFSVLEHVGRRVGADVVLGRPHLRGAGRAG